MVRLRKEEINNKVRMAGEDGENREFVHKLRKAIGHCDETTVQRLIKGGVNVNGRYWVYNK